MISTLIPTSAPVHYRCFRFSRLSCGSNECGRVVPFTDSNIYTHIPVVIRITFVCFAYVAKLRAKVRYANRFRVQTSSDRIQTSREFFERTNGRGHGDTCIHTPRYNIIITCVFRFEKQVGSTAPQTGPLSRTDVLCVYIYPPG